MSPACADLQVLLSLRAAGALEPAEEAIVERHLAGCPACSVEAARDAEVLGLARLPPVTEHERRAVADVPAALISSVRRSGARRFAWRRAAAVAGAIAAAAAIVAAPALLRPRPPEAPAKAAAAAATWQTPDLDQLWSDTEVLELEPIASVDGASGEGAPDAAVAALDEGYDGEGDY